MAKLLAEAGLADRVLIDSAGMGGWHAGELADPRTRAAAKRRGLELLHRARQFTRHDFDRFDLVVAMDDDNLDDLRRLAGTRTTPDVRLLCSFDPTAEHGACVPDPYAGGEAGFEHVLDLCERACAGLLEHVKSKL